MRGLTVEVRPRVLSILRLLSSAVLPSGVEVIHQQFATMKGVQRSYLVNDYCMHHCLIRSNSYQQSTLTW
ncbi:hypothetical protein BHM03_00025375 [Ensete ventricosum]|nr:hypothetical protein BHM03_00025375 [Ensete ventricosum]